MIKKAISIGKKITFSGLRLSENSSFKPENYGLPELFAFKCPFAPCDRFASLVNELLAPISPYTRFLSNTGHIVQRLITALVCIAILTSCKNKSIQTTVTEAQTENHSDFGFTPKIIYSDIYDISVLDGYKLITVLNPWKENDTLGRYALYPKGGHKPVIAQEADFYIPVPIDEIATLSSTHLGFLELIGELEKVVGVSNGKGIYNTYLYERFKKGEIVQAGLQMGNNLEVLLDLSPELLMKTGFDHVRDEDSRLVEAGIPIAYNIEWMESSMLARAEWIKFVAAFFNKDRIADSIFNQIEKDYNKVAALVRAIDKKPTILSGRNSKGTWYMPGGRSYIAELVKDAGGDYYFKNEPSKGNLPLSFEIVLDKMLDADIWIVPRVKSLRELELMDERYKLFKAFKKGTVYTNDNRLNENGGNDYWESGVARPDIILKDMISIIHPELVPDHELVYYRKLHGTALPATGFQPQTPNRQ